MKWALVGSPGDACNELWQYDLKDVVKVQAKKILEQYLFEGCCYEDNCCDLKAVVMKTAIVVNVA